MWQSYLNGMLVAFGLIMAIGAQNAFVLAQSLRREHHLPVAALCIVCDALLVAAGVFGLATVLAHNPTLLAVARWGGALFLIWYGAKALRSACSKQSLQHQEGQGMRSRRAVLLSALAVTLLNPHVYLDTVVLLGSLSTRYPGDLRWAFGAGACLASVAWFCALGYGARLLQPVFRRPGAWRVLDAAVAAFMFCLATLLLVRPL